MTKQRSSAVNVGVDVGKAQLDVYLLVGTLIGVPILHLLGTRSVTSAFPP